MSDKPNDIQPMPSQPTALGQDFSSWRDRILQDICSAPGLSSHSLGRAFDVDFRGFAPPALESLPLQLFLREPPWPKSEPEPVQVLTTPRRLDPFLEFDAMCVRYPRQTVIRLDDYPRPSIADLLAKAVEQIKNMGNSDPSTHYTTPRQAADYHRGVEHVAAVAARGLRAVVFVPSTYATTLRARRRAAATQNPHRRRT